MAASNLINDKLEKTNFTALEKHLTVISGAFLRSDDLTGGRIQCRNIIKY